MTVIPAVFFFVLLVAAVVPVDSTSDVSLGEVSPYLITTHHKDFLVGVMSVSAAALAAFLALVRLLADLRRTNQLIEVMASPMAGWLAALAWLLPATVVGMISGSIVLLVGAGWSTVNFNLFFLLPLLSAAGLFAAFGLLLWSFLSSAWLEGVKLYLLPMLVLFAAISPRNEDGLQSLAVLNPLFLISHVLNDFMVMTPGNAPDALGLCFLVIFPPLGVWVLTMLLCHLVGGVRSRL